MEFKMDLCGGCTTCEIACSFRQIGAFNNLYSSIEIVPLVDKPGYKVILHDQDTDKRRACSGCTDVSGFPPCVEYCVRDADLMEIIEEYRSKRGLVHSKGGNGENV